MKTIISPLLLVVSVLIIAQSCGVDCVRYSRELSTQEKLLNPYKQNDTVYFTDKLDTFNIVCTENQYSQEVDIYADHYHYDKCDGGQETYYWELSTKFISDINYTDSTLLDIEIVTKTVYSFDEAIFSIALFNNGRPMYNEEYSFYTRSNNSVRFFKTKANLATPPSALNQCELTFHDQMRLDGYLFENVNVLYGDIKKFDTVYYNSNYGIIRMVSDSVKLNIIR